MRKLILDSAEEPIKSGTDSSAWPQLVLSTTSESAAALEEAVFASGAVSVIYHDKQDQPILEPAPGESPLWDSIRLTGLYPQNFIIADALASLDQLLPDGIPEHHWEQLKDEQWERKWEDDFNPMQFAADLWICPSHCDPVDPDATNVRLDPGLAFGTGTHATTRQCLEWLGTHSLQRAKVLDYGCGSGVLGIAAALRGAAEVIAVDIDPQAISATQHNAESNGVVDLFRIGQPAIAMGEQYDIVLANILYQPLLELAPVFAECMQQGSELVMSGILLDQIESLQLRYNKWFVFEPLLHQNEWALLHAIRQSGAPLDIEPNEHAKGYRHL